MGLISLYSILKREIEEKKTKKNRSTQSGLISNPADINSFNTGKKNFFPVIASNKDINSCSNSNTISLHTGLSLSSSPKNAYHKEAKHSLNIFFHCHKISTFAWTLFYILLIPILLCKIITATLQRQETEQRHSIKYLKNNNVIQFITFNSIVYQLIFFF